MQRSPKPRSIDGFRQRPVQFRARPIRPVAPRPRPLPPLLPAKRFYASSPPTVVQKKRLPAWLETSLIVMLAIIAGMLAQSSAFGQIAAVLYGCAAFIWRIPSRITFTLALITLLSTIVLLVGKGNVLLAQNFATYTFLLLVAGVITLGRELKKEGGRVYSIRERNINW